MLREIWRHTSNKIVAYLDVSRHRAPMRTPRFLLLIVGALAIAISVSLRSTAQPTTAQDDRGVLGQYEQLVLSLSKRGDTNTAAQVASLVSAMHAGRDATDIAVTVRVLDSLRSGRTNDAIKLLETRLDGALMTFGAPSDGPRDSKYDKILKMAKEYRTKYPHTTGVPEIDTGVSRAFDSLPK